MKVTPYILYCHYICLCGTKPLEDFRTIEGRGHSSLKDFCNVPVYSVMIQNGIIRTCTLKLNMRKWNLRPGITEKETVSMT